MPITSSKKRLDLSYIINDIPMFNSEFKPFNSTLLQYKKDEMKVQLKAQKLINQQLQSKGDLEEADILNM